MRRNQWRACAGSVALAAQSLLGVAAVAATVPSGFLDSAFVGLPADATAMQFAPDGRLFVCQQSGKLRIVDNGVLRATPFLALTVDSAGERGLLGVAFDPDFESNSFIYVYYTATSPTIHNRVSRFTASGDVAVPGSEVVLLELNPLSVATIHNGGAIHFGNDGKLYVAVGDNGSGANPQSLNNLLGKILRINRDGTIPADNPFSGAATGLNRAIWAIGLRNPFTTAVQRSTGRLFINDVGAASWEEINEGAPGANFGWPLAEGPSANPDHTDPLHYYGHTNGACAITGGAFYEGPVVTFPSGYEGDYFYADHCAGWIRRIDPVTGSDVAFASGVANPVDLKVGPDGALYYLSRGGGHVGRISYSAAEPPAITLQPADRTVPVGQSASFTVGASGSAPLAYQWRRNGNAIAGANGSTYTLGAPQLSDSGAFFDVVVSNTFGSATSDSAQLTVTQNSLPAAAITQPVRGTTYAGGSVINYAGTGTDAEDGTLPASAFTWWVNLHHDAHSHPHVLPLTGAKSGSFTIPTIGETSANVFYRIHLRVTDSGGLTRSVSREVQPRKSTITLATNPTGLQLRLDGQPVTAPYTFVGVEGIVRSLEAVSPQGASATNWAFASWSDGGGRVHNVATPAADTTYTAQYVAQPTVSIQIANTSVVEGDDGTRTAAFAVTLSTASASPVGVAWKTTNGSAKSGSDYTAGSGSISFPAGSVSRTIAVTTRGDTDVEGKEVFYVDLSAPTGATIADARAIGKIKDDDGPGTLDFSASSYRKGEMYGAATITVRRTGGLGAGMTVRYAATDGTANVGADYAATSGTLIFDAGVESASFQVPITNDTLDEADETVNLALTDPAGGAQLGARSAAALTVVDNDRGGAISFSLDLYQRTESGGNATIKVLRTGGVASGVTVRYAAAAGTATAAADYTPASGTLTFSAGQTSANFQVALTNDSISEANETVNLVLSSPTGGAELGDRPTAVLTILDDE